MDTIYDSACKAIIDTIKEIGVSDSGAVANALAETDPPRQYKALQDGLRALFEDAKKNDLITSNEDLFRADLPSHVQVKRQKWYVRNLATKVCEVIEREFPGTPPVASKPPADPPTGNPVPEGSGTGEDKPSVAEEKDHGLGNGQRKKGPVYSPQQWLHVVYAPQLRHLLIDGDLWEPCLALDPPVNLSSNCYPHNMDAAKKMAEDALRLAFSDLERACVGLLKRPSLESSQGLNRIILDLQRRTQVDRFLPYVPAVFRPAVETLIKIPEEAARLQAMLISQAVTSETVANATAAYQALIRADAAAPKPVIEVVSPPAQAEATASPPSTETQPAAAEPATGGTGGTGTSGPQPVLPRRQPPDKPFSFNQDPGTQGEREAENMNGQKDSATGGTQNAISAAVNPPAAAKPVVKEFVDQATLDTKLGEVQQKVTKEVRDVFNTLVQDHLPALVKQLQPAAAAPPVTGQEAVIVALPWWKQRQNWVIAAVAALILVITISVMPGNGDPVEDKPLFSGPTLEEQLKQIPPEEETAEQSDEPQA